MYIKAKKQKIPRDHLLIMIGNVYIQLPAVFTFSGTSIYIVVTTNFAAVPVSIAVEDPSARYALLAALIITSITVPLCLVFLPKVGITKTIDEVTKDEVNRLYK